MTEPKTDAELIMEKYERMVEEGRRGPGQKDRRDKDMAKESKEEHRRLRNEKALQDHLDSVENQEGTSKQTRQPQCIGRTRQSDRGLKQKTFHSLWFNSEEHHCSLPKVMLVRKTRKLK